MRNKGILVFDRGYEEYIITTLLVLAVFAFVFQNMNILFVGILFTFTHLVHVIDGSSMRINTQLAIGFGDRWPWSRTPLAEQVIRVPMMIKSSAIRTPARIIIESKISEGYIPYSLLNRQRVANEFTLSIECEDQQRKLSVHANREEVDVQADRLRTYLDLPENSISFIQEEDSPQPGKEA